MLVVCKDCLSRHPLRRQLFTHNKSQRAPGRPGVEGSRRRDVGLRAGSGGGLLSAVAVAATAGLGDAGGRGRGRSVFVSPAMAALGRPFSGLALSGSSDFLQPPPPPGCPGRAFPPGTGGAELTPRPGPRAAPGSPGGSAARGR